MVSVLDGFDARVRDAISTLIFKNRTGAASFNRTLRMQLVQEYKALIAEQSSGGGRAPLERFDAIHR
eukprot:2213922-Prymnesium_polylepis.1